MSLKSLGTGRTWKALAGRVTYTHKHGSFGVMTLIVLGLFQILPGAVADVDRFVDLRGTSIVRQDQGDLRWRDSGTLSFREMSKT